MKIIETYQSEPSGKIFENKKDCIAYEWFTSNVDDNMKDLRQKIETLWYQYRMMNEKFWLEHDIKTFFTPTVIYIGFGVKGEEYEDNLWTEYLDTDISAISSDSNTSRFLRDILSRTILDITGLKTDFLGQTEWSVT